MLGHDDSKHPIPVISIGMVGGKGTDKGAYKDDGPKADAAPQPKGDTQSKARIAAVKDVAKALGVDPGKVDAKALDAALHDYVEACYGGEGPGEAKTDEGEKDEPDEG